MWASKAGEGLGKVCCADGSCRECDKDRARWSRLSALQRIDLEERARNWCSTAEFETWRLFACPLLVSILELSEQSGERK